MQTFYVCVSLVSVAKNKIYTFFFKRCRNAMCLCFCRWSHWECVASVFSACTMCCHVFLIITSRNTVCVCQGTPTSNAEFIYITWYSCLEWRVCVSLETLTLKLVAVQSWGSQARNAIYRVILSVLDPRKCEYLKHYSLDFEHAYMTTYLASWKACRY